MITLLDCYTDEPAGLGVPPYLGTYPRYIAGYYADKEVTYLTIDDLRFFSYYNADEHKKEISHKTNIKVYNLTNNIKKMKDIIENTEQLIVILGVHTPGKYLSAIPGTLQEIIPLLDHFSNAEKIITGPALFGTQLEGGKFSEKIDLKKQFDSINPFDFSYDELKEYAPKGKNLMQQIPDARIIEIETSHGCKRTKGCSFCTEPLKHRFAYREIEDIVKEIESFYVQGCRYFRLGKQSCFYSYQQPIELLQEIRKNCPDIKVLHIDNVDPVAVVSERGIEITKAVVKYCTAGNVAAFGIESFDPTVIKENCLNCTPKTALEAIKILNAYGAQRDYNGMPHYLSGINLLFGLKGETKDTHTFNIEFLKNILKENLLLRRINIRQVTIFEGTDLYNTVGNKFIKKNKKYYWKWRNEIRQKIDLEMLKRVVPVGTILKDVRMEVYDGNTTFGRQMGTYPLIAGIKKRLELRKSYDVRVTSHMLRSVVGEIV